MNDITQKCGFSRNIERRTHVDPDSKVHGAHMGPTGPRWAPCWPHELCYLRRSGTRWFECCQQIRLLAAIKLPVLCHVSIHYAPTAPVARWSPFHERCTCPWLYQLAARQDRFPATPLKTFELVIDINWYAWITGQSLFLKFSTPYC